MGSKGPFWVFLCVFGVNFAPFPLGAGVAEILLLPPSDSEGPEKF